MTPLHRQAGPIGLGRTERRLIETGIRQGWCEEVVVVWRIVGVWVCEGAGGRLQSQTQRESRVRRFNMNMFGTRIEVGEAAD